LRALGKRKEKGKRKNPFKLIILSRYKIDG